MKNYTYTIETLEAVISRCNFNELSIVSNSLKKELVMYPSHEINKLVYLIGEKFQSLSFAKKFYL